MGGTSSAGVSIGQMAERMGLSVHTLRFYEREGILASPVRRGPGGRRLYTDDDAEWLTVCVNLRATGMPIPDIRQYTDLVRRGDGNEQQRLDLLRQHRTRVLAQMDTLQQCLDLIGHKVAIYENIVTAMSPASPCAPADAAPARAAAHATGPAPTDGLDMERTRNCISS
jgi:DNA-binding transcriptional MerR regulator